MGKGILKGAILAFGVVILGASIFGATASAITIDEFTNGQYLESTAAAPLNSSVTSLIPVIGGYRKFRTHVTLPFPAGLAKVSLEAVSGFLAHSQSSGARGSSTAIWDGSPLTLSTKSNGLPSIDFFQDLGTRIIIDSISFDAGIGGLPINFSLKVYDASDPSGNKYSIATKVISATFTNGIEFLYTSSLNDFLVHGPNGSADFSKVGAIELFIDGTNDPAMDIELGDLKTDGYCEELPDAFGRVVDECGVCKGDNSSCAGCDGIPNSGVIFDGCGVCGGNGSTCGGCDGFGGSQDLCGVCNGDNSTCLDCSGEPLGLALVDQCGLCQGDGKSCVECEEIDISETQTELDGLAKEQEFIVRAALKLLKKAAKLRGISYDNYIQKNKKLAHELQVSNWVLSWTIPSAQNVCTNGSVCITTSNEQILTTYRSQAAKLKKIAIKATKQVAKQKIPGFIG